MLFQKRIVRASIRDLRKMGETKEDAVMAAFLERAITRINHEVFGIDAVHCAFNRHLLVPSEENRVPGIARWLEPDRYETATKGIAGSFQVEHFVSDLWMETWTKPLQGLLAIAVHEVRHRMQYHFGSDLKLWTPEHEVDGVVGQALSGAKSILDRSFHEADQEVREFDALTVELYALSQLGQGVDPHEASSFLLLSP